MLDSRNRTLVYDAEADGFLDEVTRIWCFYFVDFYTKEGFLFHDFDGMCGATGIDEVGEPFTIPKKAGSLKDGALFAHKAKSLIAHNQIGYDQFLIKKFYPKFKIRYNYPEIRDTMLESQVQWFDRPAVKGYKGIHGLAVWGARLGIRKPEIEDWKTFDIYKLNRCIKDVEINLEVAKKLETERTNIKEKCGIDFTEALETEHEYRYWCSYQEQNGALVDVPHMKSCIGILDKELEKYRSILEPQLPPTVSITSQKITKKELFELLGIKRKIPVEYVFKERNGETKQYEVKEWYKPTTKWLSTKKSKRYGISDHKTQEVLEEKRFTKLKEARDFAKEHYPNIKKFSFPNVEVVDYEFNHHTKNHFGETLEEVEIVGNFSKVSIEDSRLSQHEKIKLYLLGIGWDTDEWTFETDEDDKPIRATMSGRVVWPNRPFEGKQLVCDYKAGDKIPKTPKVSEDSFETLPEGVGEDIKKYNAYSHRRKFIENPKKDEKGLLNNIRKDGRITCGIMTFGTTAGRALLLWVLPALKQIRNTFNCWNTLRGLQTTT